MRINKIVFTVLCGLMASNALSYTECTRTVDKVWNSLTGSASVWIAFSNGVGAIYKDELQLTEGQMARFFSLALTAKATGSSLIVRYPEDGFSCSTTVNRGDAEGLWLK